MRLTDSLFFAIVPDEAARARISDIAERLRARHALKAKAIPADRLHITLHYLGAFDGVPVEIVDNARRAASQVVLPPVDVTLDRIESFSRRRAKRPLVFAGDAGESLAALEANLAAALDVAGVPVHRHPQFRPHVTLLYDEHRVARQAAPEPVTWTSHDFALMRSHLGRSRHETLARWPLAS